MCPEQLNLRHEQVNVKKVLQVHTILRFIFKSSAVVYLPFFLLFRSALQEARRTLLCSHMKL